MTDHQEDFPFVGQLAWPDSSCSGILITPAWVLTANHCLTGDLTKSDCELIATGVPPSKVGDDVGVSFALKGAVMLYDGIDEPFTAWHTSAKSGDVLVRFDHPLNECDDGDVVRDMALVQLDRRIPISVVAPKHVPGIGPNPGADCRSPGGLSDFGATLVGFGGQAEMRNYLYSEDWARRTKSGGAIYQNAWLADGGYPGASEHGDSGGPLLRGGALCGVTSGYRFGGHWEWVGWGPAKVPIWVPVRYTNTAAVDSTQAQNFLGKVLDQDGRLMGECLPNEGDPNLRDVDSDGDLLPDACDPCPYVEDPEYRKTGKVVVYTDPRTGEKFGPGCCAPSYRNRAGYDPALEMVDRDEDTIPELCDTCVEKPNPEQVEAVEPDPGHGQHPGQVRQLSGGGDSGTRRRSVHRAQLS